MGKQGDVGRSAARHHSSLLSPLLLHINARIRYADPDADARTRLAEEMEQEEEEAEQALVRLYNEAYLQRMGRPQEFGV